MDLSGQQGVSGLHAVASSQGEGVIWKARHGEAPEGRTVSLATATAALALVGSSAEASGQVRVVLDALAAGCDVVALAPHDSIDCAGVTGTNSGDVNTTFPRVANVNGFPSWEAGTVTWRCVDYFWEIARSGVVQFRAAAPIYGLPTQVANWLAVGTMAGTPDVGIASNGDAVVLNRAGWVDFEKRALGDPDGVRGLEVVCTAGSLAVAWGTGMVVLGVGDSYLFLRPEGLRPGWLGTSVSVTMLEAAAAFESVMLLEEGS